MTDPDAEAALRAIVDERVAAVAAKDPAPLYARQHPDVRGFNVLPPLQLEGRDAVGEQTQGWFDGYPGSIGYEVRDLRVSAGNGVGFCSFVYHVSGTLADGTEVSMWVRATLGCEQQEGSWVIVHDHESVPFDPATGQALISLEP